MSRKSELLAAARAGGAAAVKVKAAEWPSAVYYNGNRYVLRSVGPNHFAPSMIVGHYTWRDRGVALTLADAIAQA